MTAPQQPVPAAPATVVAAYRLFLLSAVLGLVDLVVTLVLLPGTTRIAAERTSGAGLDPGALAVAGAWFLGVLATVVAVVFAVLTVVLARRMARGGDRARVVLAVLAALRLVGLIGTSGGVPGVLLSLLTVAVAVAAAVLTFLPASRRWFDRAPEPVSAV